MVLFGIIGELGCHSEDTQVLTPEGIKNFKDLHVGDKVFAINPETNELVTTTILKTYEYDYEGKMYNFFSKRYDFLVTPNHRMLFRKENENKFRYVEAEKINCNGYFPSSYNTVYIKLLSDFLKISKRKRLSRNDAPFDISKNLKIVDYKGKVYSFETLHGNYFTIRNGKVGVSGNSGKTLTLTYMAWNNWFYKHNKIFSNYRLFMIPYYYIKGLNQLSELRDGFVAVDEMWSIIDARTSQSRKNKLVADILMKSRKRNLNYSFTAQMLDLLDKRIRKIMDFTAYPILNPAETICKVVVFRTGYPNESHYMSQFYYLTELVFKFYNTNEEIMMEEEYNAPLVPIFQESPDKKPIEFKTWEEADKYAEEYWRKLIRRGVRLPS